MNEPSFVIEPLGRHHDRAAFACGEPALDAYLQRQASQDVRRRVAQIFVASGERPGSVAGYYALSATSFDRADLPTDQSKRLPHYPVPAAVIGRLAVSIRAQGQGLGEALLLDAVQRVIWAGSAMGVYAVVVDAKNDGVRAFYERYGFRRFESVPRRLFLPLETFIKAGL